MRYDDRTSSGPYSPSTRIPNAQRNSMWGLLFPGRSSRWVLSDPLIWFNTRESNTPGVTMVQKAAQSAVCRLRNSREKHPQPMNSRRIHLPFFAEKLRS